MYTKHDFDRDSQLIDKLIIINAGLSQDSYRIKQAGIVETLSGIANTVKELVGTRIKEEGALGAAATYLVPMLLKGPLRWITLVAYWLFDISVGDLLNKAFNLAKGVIDSTGDFKDSDATNIANDLTTTLFSTSSLASLYELEKQGKLVSAMQGKLIKEGRVFGGSSLASQVKNLLRSLDPRRSRILGGGLIRWVITAVLMGLSGIVAIEGPTLISKLMGGEEKTEETSSESSSWGLLGSPEKPESAPKKPTYNLPPVVPHDLKPTTRGQQYHVNSGNTMWFVRLLNRNIPSTLLAWATTIYPELSGHTDEVLNSPSFNTMVSKLGTLYDPVNSADYLRILPDSGLHSWKDIVDRFVGDVAKNIKA